MNLSHKQSGSLSRSSLVTVELDEKAEAKPHIHCKIKPYMVGANRGVV